MSVQALYRDSAYNVNQIRYDWTTERTLFLILECNQVPLCANSFSFLDLLAHLDSFCSWQRNQVAMIGIGGELIEVLTLYHEFDFAGDPASTLMLVSTPPDEYFEAQAA